jgi:hypothetical protein
MREYGTKRWMEIQAGTVTQKTGTISRSLTLSTLVAGETYNYCIRTGSYPQVHHESELLTANGWINCTQFTDANGKKHDNWIPAIRLEGAKKY